MDGGEVSEAVEWEQEGREAGQGDSWSGISQVREVLVPLGLCAQVDVGLKRRRARYCEGTPPQLQPE